jgi:DNA-binding LytR/AlgR family response regulator
LTKPPVLNKAFDKTASPSVQSGQEIITIRADKKIYPVNTNDILYIQALGDYLRVYCKGTTLVTHETMKGICSKLTDGKFIRVHKSYAVNISHVDYMDGNVVSIGKEKLPIGRSYKDAVSDIFRSG